LFFIAHHPAAFAGKDNSNRVTWERFQEGANRVFFHNDLPGAWRYLTATRAEDVGTFFLLFVCLFVCWLVGWLVGLVWFGFGFVGLCFCLFVCLFDVGIDDSWNGNTDAYTARDIIWMYFFLNNEYCHTHIV